MSRSRRKGLVPGLPTRHKTKTKRIEQGGPTNETLIRKCERLGIKWFIHKPSGRVRTLGDPNAAADAIDILFRHKHITEVQHKAGVLYARNYHALYGKSWPQIASYSATVHEHLDADTMLANPKTDEEREAALETISSRMASADAMLDQVERNVRNQVNAVCIDSTIPSKKEHITDLQHGLTLIAGAFGLTQGRTNGYGRKRT